MGLMESLQGFMKDKAKNYVLEENRPELSKYVEDDFIEKDQENSAEEQLFKSSMNYDMENMEKEVKKIREDMD